MLTRVSASTKLLRYSDFLQFLFWAAERWYWAVAYPATCTNLVTLIMCWTDSKVAATFTNDWWLQWAWLMISRHTKRCFQPLARTHCDCVPSEVNIGYSERQLWIQWECCQSVARAPLGCLVSVQCQCVLTGKRAKTPAGFIRLQQRHSAKSRYCNNYWPKHSYAVQFVRQVKCREVCSQRDEQRYQPICSSSNSVTSDTLLSMTKAHLNCVTLISPKCVLTGKWAKALAAVSSRQQRHSLAGCQWNLPCRAQPCTPFSYRLSPLAGPYLVHCCMCCDTYHVLVKHYIPILTVSRHMLYDVYTCSWYIHPTNCVC